MEPIPRRDSQSSAGGSPVNLDTLGQWFEELYIHESCWDSEVAKRVRSIVSVPAKCVSERPYKDSKGTLDGTAFSHSKKRLYLSPHDGHFFRKCPGTQGAACCNYFVLNLGVQCNMNCSYCYLQSYINSPLTQIYTNIDSALQELDEIAERFPKSGFRVGTGETIDSLSLDDLTLYSATLVSWFAKHSHLTCEFKTKSDNIKNFVHLPHARNVVVSFSVNPEQIVQKEEHGTASLKRRLSAARLAADKGFPVAFHIDPMIYVPDWKTLYSELVEQITALFSPKEVKWISLGALRYPPDMKHILRERFAGNSAALSGELHLSSDGKLRYDQGLRNQMFNHVIGEFRSRDKSYPVFLCMEAPETWLGTFEASPRRVDGLEELFKPMAAP
jgi:spore photoproduct lyase